VIKTKKVEREQQQKKKGKKHRKIEKEKILEIIIQNI
jgi:hypothetical protein